MLLIYFIYKKKPFHSFQQPNIPYQDDEKITTLFGMQGCKKPFRFRLEPGAWWEIVLNIKPR